MNKKQKRRNQPNNQVLTTGMEANPTGNRPENQNWLKALDTQEIINWVMYSTLLPVIVIFFVSFLILFDVYETETNSIFELLIFHCMVLVANGKFALLSIYQSANSLDKLSRSIGELKGLIDKFSVSFGPGHVSQARRLSMFKSIFVFSGTVILLIGTALYGKTLLNAIPLDSHGNADLSQSQRLILIASCALFVSAVGMNLVSIIFKQYSQWFFEACILKQLGS